MATKPDNPTKPDYTNDATGELKPPTPLPWEPPGGLNHHNVRRGRDFGKRRPR